LRKASALQVRNPPGLLIRHQPFGEDYKVAIGPVNLSNVAAMASGTPTELQNSASISKSAIALGTGKTKNPALHLFRVTGFLGNRKPFQILFLYWVERRSLVGEYC